MSRFDQQHHIQELRLKHRSQNIPIQLSGNPERLHVSKTPLNSLEQISLLGLRLKEAHRGRCIILRTLEIAKKNNGIITIVEDREGTVAACLFSICVERLHPDLEDSFPAGTVFYLKEPYYDISHRAHTCNFVYSHSPSNIIIVHEHECLQNDGRGIEWRNSIDPSVVDNTFARVDGGNAVEWLNRGKDYLKAEKFQLAIRCYVLAVKHSISDPKFRLTIILHLSTVCLKFKLFERSLKYAQQVLKISCRNVEAMTNAGISCYELEKYTESKMYFLEYTKRHAGDYTYQLDVCKLGTRIGEHENGAYIFAKIQPALPITCADYTVPIKLLKIKGFRSIVVATRDALPGTLLLLTKALAFRWNSEDNFAASKNMVGVLTHQLVEKIAKNPETFGPIIYNLYTGNNPAEEPLQLFCDPETRNEPIIDILKLNSIANDNTFGLSNTTNKRQQFKAGFGVFDWLSSLYFGMLPNAKLYNVNDVVVVVATHFIKANEDIVLCDLC